jgi:glycine/D-amino acid oxidase-like deaminating enzyme
MAFSYWESNEWLEDVDLLVVGGGIVGLSAAFRAREMHPEWRILVVEADPFGGGGSSRNAGFTCFGSATELMQDRKTLGDHAALELVRQRWNGLQKLRATFGDLALGHQASGSIELFPSFAKPRLQVQANWPTSTAGLHPRSACPMLSRTCRCRIFRS